MKRGRLSHSGTVEQMMSACVGAFGDKDLGASEMIELHA